MLIDHIAVTALLPVVAARHLIEQFGMHSDGDINQHRALLRDPSTGIVLEINAVRTPNEVLGHVGFGFDKKTDARKKFQQLKDAGLVMASEDLQFPNRPGPRKMSFSLLGNLRVELGWDHHLNHGH